MEFSYLPLVLLLACLTTGTWQASPFSHRPHRTLPRSTAHRRDLSFSSGLPPDHGNSTETLCFLLPFAEVARPFGDGCSAAFAQLDDLSLTPEMEKKALEDVCTTECIGKVITFFRDDCQDDIVAASLLSFCTESPSGARCYNVTSTYNWTEFNSGCLFSLDGSPSECSEKCLEATLDALETVDCCSNYDYSLSLSVEECNLQMPPNCPDPFKVEEEEEEEKNEDDEENKMGEGSDKVEGGDSPGEEQLDTTVRGSSDPSALPFTALTLSLLITCIVFS